MFSVLKAFFEALTAYFQLRSKVCLQELLQKSYDTQDSIVKEMDKLGENPNPANQYRIDVLQLRLGQERQRALDISAISTKSTSLSGN